MSTQSRLGLERFGRDMRMAVDIWEVTANHVSLDIQAETGTRTVDYIYEPENNRLIRVENGWTLTVIENIKSFSLRYYNLMGNETSILSEVKKIQFEALLEDTVFQVENTTNVISAKFMLRNHKVS